MSRRAVSAPREGRRSPGGARRLAPARADAVKAGSARVWLFDLDNTLHNAGASAFRHFDTTMNRYIVEQLGVEEAEADRLRRDYWRRYGSTLLGLVRHHGVRPAHFVRHTHAFPGLESTLVAHAHDLAALRRLPGRKVVLSNAGRDYALRVLRALGLDRKSTRLNSSHSQQSRMPSSA